MRVAVSVFKDVFEDDGITLRVQRVLQALDKRYHTTVITCSDWDKTKLEGMENVPVITIKGISKHLIQSNSFTVKMLFGLLWNLKLAIALLRNSFDVVYCVHDIYGFLSIYLVSKIKRYKMIFEAHDSFSKYAREQRRSDVRLKLDQVLAKFAAKHCDLIITLSKDIFDFYQPYSNKISLAPDYIDDATFKVKQKTEGRDSKLVGLIGPFDTSPRKETALDFFYANVERFDRRIKFVIIGHCLRKIGNPRIIYTGYLDSHQDYLDQLSCLDAVLVPVRVATFGLLNRIVEPMSCALPVFTTPKGMIGFYRVKPGRDILVFEEDVLVDKINELIFDGEFMAKIGRNARKVVEQYYSRRANEGKLIKVLESVTGIS